MLDKHPSLFPLHDFETSMRGNWQPCGEAKILAGSSDPLHLNTASPELYVLLLLHCRNKCQGTGFFLQCYLMSLHTSFLNTVFILFHPTCHFGP